MSFFDTIHYNGLEYQTHDLEDQMAEYRFDEDNMIIMTHCGTGHHMSGIEWTTLITATGPEGKSVVFQLRRGKLVGFVSEDDILGMPVEPKDTEKTEPMVKRSITFKWGGMEVTCTEWEK